MAIRESKIRVTYQAEQNGQCGYCGDGEDRHNENIRALGIPSEDMVDLRLFAVAHWLLWSRDWCIGIKLDGERECLRVIALCVSE